MRPFAALTPRGQVGRLRRVALPALGRYELEGARVRPLDNAYNAIFRVDAPDGAPLRVADRRARRAQPRRHPLRVVVAGGPAPGHAPGGAGAAAGARWRARRHGRGAGDTPTPRIAHQLGRAAATLHDHADRFVPPAGFTERRLDAAAPDERFPPARRAVFRAAAARVGAAIAALYADPGGLRFLHTDLHLWNAKVYRGALRLLDFDDSRWCYPVQDLGIALFHL